MKLIIAALSFLPLLAHAQVNSPVDNKIDKRDFAFAASLAIERLANIPQLAQVYVLVKSLPRPLAPSATIDVDRWKFAPYGKIRESLALYDLAQQVGRNPADAAQDANIYWTANAVGGSFSDFLNADYIASMANWSDVAAKTVTCTNGYRVIDARSKKTARLDGDETLVNGVIWTWNDGAKTYTVNSMGPLDDDKSQTTKVYLTAAISNAALGESPAQIHSRAQTSIYFVDKSKKGVQRRDSDNEDLITRTQGSRRVSQDLTGKEGESVTVRFDLPNGQFTTSSVTDGDQGIKLSGYKVLNKNSACIYANFDGAKVALDPFLKDLLAAFDTKFSATQGLRAAWYDCVAGKTSGECKTEEQNYATADLERDALFTRSLVNLTSFPARRLIPRAVEVPQVSGQVLRPQIEAPAAKLVAAPFEILGRDCKSVSVQGDVVAMCNGGMACTYTSAKSASCSDGSTCTAAGCK